MSSTISSAGRGSRAWVGSVSLLDSADASSPPFGSASEETAGGSRRPTLSMSARASWTWICPPSESVAAAAASSGRNGGEASATAVTGPKYGKAAAPASRIRGLRRANASPAPEAPARRGRARPRLRRPRTPTRRRRRIGSLRRDSRPGDARPARAVARGQPACHRLPAAPSARAASARTGMRSSALAPGRGWNARTHAMATAFRLAEPGFPSAGTIQSRAAPSSCPVAITPPPFPTQVAHRREAAGVPATSGLATAAGFLACRSHNASRPSAYAKSTRAVSNPGWGSTATHAALLVASRRDVSSPLSRNAELLDPSADASSSSSTDRSSHGTTPMAWSEVTAYARGARTPPSAPGRAAAPRTVPEASPSRMNGERRRAATAVTSFGHRVDASSVCDRRSRTSTPLSTETRMTLPTLLTKRTRSAGSRWRALPGAPRGRPRRAP